MAATTLILCQPAGPNGSPTFANEVSGGPAVISPGGAVQSTATTWAGGAGASADFHAAGGGIRFGSVTLTAPWTVETFWQPDGFTSVILGVGNDATDFGLVLEKFVDELRFKVITAAGETIPASLDNAGIFPAATMRHVAVSAVDAGDGTATVYLAAGGLILDVATGIPSTIAGDVTWGDHLDAAGVLVYEGSGGHASAYGGALRITADAAKYTGTAGSTYTEPTSFTVEGGGAIPGDPVSRTLTGVEAAGEAGTLTPSAPDDIADIIAILAGLLPMLLEQEEPPANPGVTRTLLGVEASGQAGQVLSNPETGRVIDLGTGAQAIGEAGTLTPIISVPLAGHQAAGSVGEVSAEQSGGSIARLLAGNAATGEAGILTPQIEGLPIELPSVGFRIEMDAPTSGNKVRVVSHKTTLQRVLEARAERRVKPKRERPAQRARAVEIKAAAQVLADPVPDLAGLFEEWRRTGPSVPQDLAGTPMFDLFLAGVRFRLAQQQALEKAQAIEEARRQRDEEDAALLLL